MLVQQLVELLEQPRVRQGFREFDEGLLPHQEYLHRFFALDLRGGREEKVFDSCELVELLQFVLEPKSEFLLVVELV